MLIPVAHKLHDETGLIYYNMYIFISYYLFLIDLPDIITWLEFVSIYYST